MTKEEQTEIEGIIAAYPVCQYAFLKPEEIEFPERVRIICETECPRYNTTWACHREWARWRNAADGACHFRTCFW